MWDSRTLRCVCHDADCCPDYEAWCSEQDAEAEWNAMTEAEREETRRFCAAIDIVRTFGGIMAPDWPF